MLVLLPLVAALSISGDYALWWGQRRGWGILLETLCFAGFASLVATLAGSVVARAGWGWVVAACVPLVLPASLMGSAWIVAWGRQSILGAWVNVYDWPIAAGVVGLRYVGLAGMILLAQGQPANPASILFSVRHAWWWLGVRPRLRPVLLSWAVVMLWASAEPIMPSMFLVHTYSTQVLIQANALLDPAGAVALAVPVMFVGLGLILILTPRGTRWVSASVQENHEESPRGRRLHTWICRGAGAGVLLAALGGPLAALVMRTPEAPAILEAWRDAWPELRHTLWLAGTAGPASACCGWVLASYYQRALGRSRPTLVPATLLTTVIPPAVLALGWIELAGRWPLVMWRDTSVVLWVAYVLRLAPIAAVIILIANLRRSETPTAAARVHRLSFRKRLVWIDWPLHQRAVVYATAISALLVITELELSILLTPAGTNTVGVRLYTLIHTAPDAMIAATSLAVALTILPLVALGGAVFMWRRT